MGSEKSLMIIAFSLMVPISDNFESGFWSMKSVMNLARNSFVTIARLGLRSCLSDALEKSTIIVRYLISDFLLTSLLKVSTSYLNLRRLYRFD